MNHSAGREHSGKIGAMPPRPPAQAAEAWFESQGWRPFDFQREVWDAMAAGTSGLLHATTRSSKTYSAWLGALNRAAVVERARARPSAKVARRGGKAGHPAGAATGLQVLWLTPMRALAADTTRAVQRPLADIAPAWPPAGSCA